MLHSWLPIITRDEPIPDGEDKIRALLVFNHNNHFIVEYDDQTGKGTIFGINRTSDGNRYVTGSFNTNNNSALVSYFDEEGNGYQFETDDLDGGSSLLNLDNYFSLVGGFFDEEAFNNEVSELSNQDIANVGTFMGGQIMRGQKDENGIPSIHGDFVRLFEKKGKSFDPIKNGRSYFRAISDMVSNKGGGETISLTIENINVEDNSLLYQINYLL